ncbi:glycosyltransferase [Paenibacillus sp. FSL W8-0187]|uniref:glycosyltransferase n=1 Tax=Paenibacillus sp. FSL W8-0187 TaxID=2921710 RepID=UPI0030DCAD58
MPRTKILAFCLQKIPSAIVGVSSPLILLQSKGTVEYRFKETLNVDKQDIAWADVIVCIRGCENLELDIMKEGGRLKKKLLYFLDDDLLNVPQNTASTLYFSMPHIRSNIIEILKLSNYLWTTNKNIANKYGHYSESSVIINAPSVLLESISSLPMQSNNNQIVIGFSGSMDHGFFLNDFFQKVAFNILDLFPNVSFEFFGAKPDFCDHERIHHLTYADNYDDYIEIMRTRKWDIGLAPLPSSDFHKCKYFNKYLEYGAIGVPGIYSNVEPYVFIVENGKNGVLVNNSTNEWVNAIKNLIENKMLRQKIIEESRTRLESHFTLDKIADEIVSRLPVLITYHAPHCIEKDVKLRKRPRNLYIFKTMQILKTSGIKGVFIILKKIFKKIYSM